MVTSTKLLAVIPARGGSKRIPHKNIIDFFGKPLIAYTIEAALNSGIFEKVVVSTDDQAIAEVALKYGAEVPFLRTEFADDMSPVSLATVHTVQKLMAEKHEDYDVVAQLMPNCPLRTEQQIVNAYQHFLKTNATFQVSCFEFGWMNPWWAHIQQDQAWKPLFPDQWQQRSQDQPKAMCPTGAVWLAKTDELLKAGSFYGKGYQLCEMSWEAAVDIDTLNDLEMAKAVYLKNHEKIT